MLTGFPFPLAASSEPGVLGRTLAGAVGNEARGASGELKVVEPGGVRAAAGVPLRDGADCAAGQRFLLR
ncbi:hypothetical protein BS642_18880 [Chromobacterium violaceum]|nr:hypothetical protein BS642_18880 [Chromobacterium violaceum]